MSESQAEIGDEEAPNWGVKLGAVLAPLVFVVVWVAPIPVDVRAHRLAAIFAAVVVAWVTEVLPIPVTALLIAPALVAAGVTDARTAFAPYADPLLFLFVGGFFLARAMMRHGLDRRLAHMMVSSAFVRGAPSRMRIMLIVNALLLSMWMSNTAATAVLMPVLLGFAGGAATGTKAPRDRALGGSVLAVAYACSLGGLGTIVGTPPNLVTARFIQEAGVKFGFMEWFQIGFPAAVATLVVMHLVFKRMFPFSGGFVSGGSVSGGAARPPAGSLALAGLRDDGGEATPLPIGKLSKGEKVTAVAFVLAILGWIVPPILEALQVPGNAALNKALPADSVAIVAASLLFMFKDDSKRERVLPWHDAVRIDWGIILLFGGGISLGTQLMDTGLATYLGRQFVEVSGFRDLWTLTAALTAFSLVLTEICSNTATANMLVPLAVAIAVELGVSPIPPALGVGMAASCGFMLPIATGPNAIAYGTGHVTMMDMVRTGVVLDVICVTVILALLYILCPLYGWT